MPRPLFEPSVISNVTVDYVKGLMSNPLYTGWQRILEGQGLEVAFTGMFIVFLALAAISFCIAMLPRVAAALGGMPLNIRTTPPVRIPRKTTKPWPRRSGSRSTRSTTTGNQAMRTD